MVRLGKYETHLHSTLINNISLKRKICEKVTIFILSAKSESIKIISYFYNYQLN